MERGACTGSFEQGGNHCAVLMKRLSLQPGETAKLKVTVLAKYLNKVKSSPRVLLITNDPARSKEIITVNVKQ